MPGWNTKLVDRVMRYLHTCSLEGHAPSIREIAAAVGTSKSNVHRYLYFCRDYRGWIEWKPRQHRGIRVVKLPSWLG